MNAGWELGYRFGIGLKTLGARMGCNSQEICIYIKSTNHPLAMGHSHFQAIERLRVRPELPRNGAIRKGILTLDSQPL